MAAEEGEVKRVVVRLEEDLILLISALSDVVGDSGEVDAVETGHT